MKWLFHTKKTDRSRPTIFNRLDTHNWANKMEIHRLLSGKPEMKLKTES